MGDWASGRALQVCRSWSDSIDAEHLGPLQEDIATALREAEERGYQRGLHDRSAIRHYEAKASNAREEGRRAGLEEAGGACDELCDEWRSSARAYNAEADKAANAPYVAASGAMLCATRIRALLDKEDT